MINKNKLHSAPLREPSVTQEEEEIARAARLRSANMPNDASWFWAQAYALDYVPWLAQDILASRVSALEAFDDLGKQDGQ